MNLRGKRIALTGASAGIGRELALQLARRGARLALGARSSQALEEVATACRNEGGEAIVVSCDVAHAAECRAFVETAAGAFGGLDILVNNAGVTMVARFDEVQDLGVFEQILRVNYLGAVYCTHAALPHLRASRGLLVAISSLSGLTGVPSRTAYSASKHAMQGFFDSLRVELRGSGVDVLVVSPGFVSTQMRERAFGPDGQKLGHDPRVGKRAMTTERCAALIVRAIRSRRRELVMTAAGRVVRFANLLLPGLVDAFTARVMK